MPYSSSSSKFFFNTCLLLCYYYDNPKPIYGAYETFYNFRSQGASKWIKDLPTNTKCGLRSHCEDRNGQHIMHHCRKDRNLPLFTFQ